MFLNHDSGYTWSLDSLELIPLYRKRQATITTELIEIIAGASALMDT
jgi:hypothetical protein